MAVKQVSPQDFGAVPDEVSYTRTCYRRWWQFWKPKSWTERNRYRVVPGIQLSGDANATTIEGCHFASQRHWVTEWDDHGNAILPAQPASVDTHAKHRDVKQAQPEG